MADWIADVLGDEFEQLTLALGDDDQGPVVATLVRALPAEQGWWDRLRGRTPMLDGVDVLYVHGWSDYFFQKRLARFWTSRGARFFALDLRKYGRSLRDGQTPGYVTDLATYDEDIAAALDAMGHAIDGSDGRELVLLGHSTGGLVLSLWASRHPEAADAVILNSPWLEFQIAPVRAAIAPMVELQARIRPREVAPQGAAGGRGSRRSDGGESALASRADDGRVRRLAARHPVGPPDGRVGAVDPRAGLRAPLGPLGCAHPMVGGAHGRRLRAGGRRHRTRGPASRSLCHGGTDRRRPARRVPLPARGEGRRVPTTRALGRRLACVRRSLDHT
jgi:pimeloyl-ACP methyl ester carboxylesterase